MLHFSSFDFCVVIVRERSSDSVIIHEVCLNVIVLTKYWPGAKLVDKHFVTIPDREPTIWIQVDKYEIFSVNSHNFGVVNVEN